ncbi:tRNA (uracil-5-)-methyltransferase [Trypanosoma rangeli]|uniref:tRNA (Uracil-5-)-methyltransferase n=1 Tax=Trypanosoma rangeli TaxID=5698 RepID=A0A422NTL8_TRYRA|nr:tRNA (uracil-5-)-methyltransferase [Trypanosoma rangeli]RNF08813.1 tRNA (uracil-5-)-methyltransferase [Trypanosoma rangeli]|eukprot:RNF08813.1 tRNA (uracil-5-)-methyltransferase [Trypanosoma rangeli]
MGIESHESGEKEVSRGPTDGVVLREHSNENLLKFDTHDNYSTTSVIKKMIMKSLPPPKTNAPPQPLFNGLLRMGKNPNTPLLFMAFQTPEDGAAAAELLRGMLFRGKKQVAGVTRDAARSAAYPQGQCSETAT